MNRGAEAAPTGDLNMLVVEKQTVTKLKVNVNVNVNVTFFILSCCLFEALVPTKHQIDKHQRYQHWANKP
jgi:hypothetical protein